jgi:UDP-N-acetylglucosamine/UDP-N-acetylgalactosamine diphosphorylase|eukprot:g5680.t1 g5680   contig2:1050162-1051728(-)
MYNEPQIKRQKSTGSESTDYPTLLASITTRLQSVDQSHILAHLSDESIRQSSKLSFLQSINEIPLENLASYLKGALEEEEKLKNFDPNNVAPEDVITPFDGKVASTTSTDADQRTALEEANKLGLESISKGQVAALLLAGGQGTRLGYDGPKGMYDIGMPSGRTLFQLMAERIKKLGELSGGGDKAVPFYIMTSPLNHQATTEYFAKHDNFGIDVTFFPQGTLPAVTPEGKMILETATSLAVAPDGNGGIYPAMVKHGVLKSMVERGIKYIHAFGVDNALVKPADPTFVGYCISQNADCGNKVLWKSSPDEKVGVVATKGGKPCIVEYSDISKEMSERKGDDGRLIFGAGNICNHFYTLDFLNDVVVPNLGNMYHVARKKIPYFDESSKSTVKPSENNGIKLESFIFDIFPLSTSMAVLDVARVQEFAPVKNPPGTNSDSPDTARALFSNVAKKWLQDAGAKLVGDVESDLCEVGPLSSYNGEGLDEWKNKEVDCPFSI